MIPSPRHESERVAVTGAGGFIGSALCRRLAADSDEVVPVDLPEVDITDAAAVRAALAGVDAVVHTAAIVGDAGSMADFVAVNTRGTRNVLDAAEAAGARRTVVLASVAVWGYDFRHDIAEDAPLRTCGDPYIDTKAATETMALLRGATVIRPGDVYGPGSIWVDRPLDALRRRRFALPGRADGLMTPVYVDDLVDAIVRALRVDRAAGRAYTVWDGHAVTAREFFAFHARWLGRREVPRLPRPLIQLAGAIEEAAARVTGSPPTATRRSATFISRRAVYPNTRAREELGWEPTVRLEEGMRRCETALRAEGRI